MSKRLQAILSSVLLGLTSVAATVRWAGEYGFVIFCVVPVVMSMVASFIYLRNDPRLNEPKVSLFGAAYGISVLSFVATGAGVLIFAFDGLLCVLMAAPLALILALPGSMIGLAIAGRVSGGKASRGIVVLMLILPMLIAAEAQLEKKPPLHKVVTSIEVEAPIQRVWEMVIAFPEISEAPGLLFRLGIAYPIRARVEGSGVGAVRYCEFSTGPFVEPITTWKPPTLLAFEVASSPEPMHELSPYPDLDVPHLHGFLRSERGQFKLREVDGKTIIEGTTWYRHDLSPDGYWAIWSDLLIHQIHQRVLEHIKQHAEALQ